MRYTATHDLNFVRSPDGDPGDHQICVAGTILTALRTVHAWDYRHFAKKDMCDPNQLFIVAEWEGRERYFEIGKDVKAVGGRSLGRGRKATRKTPPNPAIVANRDETAQGASDVEQQKPRRKGGRGGRRRISRP